MGLQGQLNDAASGSIPLYLVALLAAFFRHLRSIFFSIRSSESDPFTLLGSGLAGLVLLSDQLSLNRDLSYDHAASRDRTPDSCIFCLSSLHDGDRVRQLSCCRHVFHKDCLDTWLDQLSFSCPLCRSPLVPPNRLDSTRRRLAHQLVGWFAVR